MGAYGYERPASAASGLQLEGWFAMGHLEHVQRLLDDERQLNRDLCNQLRETRRVLVIGFGSDADGVLANLAEHVVALHRKRGEEVARLRDELQRQRGATIPPFAHAVADVDPVDGGFGWDG